MKAVIRKVDNVGRIKIPDKILKELSINNGDSLEYFIEKKLIIVKKFK